MKGKGKREPTPDDSSKKAGRPTLFKKEYVRYVRNLARLGALEKDIADFFGISVKTLELWKRTNREFIGAMREGRIMADAEIADSLYHRARGYSHRAVKIFADPKSGKQLVVPFTEHYPPDTAACSLWLRNRQPKLWRDKIEVSHGVEKSLEDLVTGSMDMRPAAAPAPAGKKAGKGG
ncbi:MAG: helix-turn-helix domain-containing protein [Deltaproteobacteria bacterium]|nr:helix-turn-helix domain-containing protein [Deltaproteobacteria bacterium]